MTRVRPHRDLTEMETVVAECLSRGKDYVGAAKELGIKKSTVRSHVRAISQKLPNPDNIHPLRHVMLWAAREAWLTKTGVSA
jgi:DNA-binding NarL/FixJ family response regulator